MHKEFIVDKNEVKMTEKAIYLPIARKSGGVVDHKWFPLSQISYEDMGRDVRVKIPQWLYKKNVGTAYTIGAV